jgi:benzodiazapine receptor
MRRGRGVLTFARSQLFFGMHHVELAFLDIAVLTPITYALTYKAFKVDPRTIWLLAPLVSALRRIVVDRAYPFLYSYCAWLSFATYLNGKRTFYTYERCREGCR